MKHILFYLSLIILLFCRQLVQGQETITFGTLVDEMTDLERLASIPDQSYRVIQYSSYDRRSHTPGMEGWFSNSDGFGGEPIPGFEKVIEKPDDTGMGTFLICDVEGPGAILRLWTANINGRIRLYLDNLEKPVYDGEAEKFFWHTASELSGVEDDLTSPEIHRQFDATYFPIPFSERCRIEWIGNINKIHFYHVGVRLYESGAKVETFKPGDIIKYNQNLEALKSGFNSNGEIAGDEPSNTDNLNVTVPGNSAMEVIHMEGAKAIDFFSIKMMAKDLELALRTNILNIYFDGAETPQVQSPIGDFFGAAPGLNPYISYPFSVQTDGTMTCRFVMPFNRSARIEIENISEDTVKLSGLIHFKDFKWKEGVSMHFRARWKLNHGLTASNSNIVDIPYFITTGKGRIVGAAAFLYNPSNAVVSWGNWWGEGDEKIFIDNDTFPSFFGTGSEDYFNYSWSAEKFFSFPYCGQPRNDGPGNRGYVSNFRWHISDDLIFNEKVAFYMELFHHGVVPDFSYGRIVYAYALPGCIDDFSTISKRDAHLIPYMDWEPLAYLGSSGYSFIQSEDLVFDNPSAIILEGKRWSGGKIVLWEPEAKYEKLNFIIDKPENDITGFGITLGHMPQGGEITILLNGDTLTLNNREIIDLNDPYRTFLRNYVTKTNAFKPGKNEVTFVYQNEDPGNKIGIDFFWLREK